MNHPSEYWEADDDSTPGRRRTNALIQQGKLLASPSLTN